MQLKTLSITPQDVEKLGFVDKLPSGKDFYELESELQKDYWSIPDPDIVEKYYRLQKIEFAYNIYQPKYLRTRYREDSKHYITELSDMVWGQKNKDLFIEYPETWWDAFKNQWYPEWLLRRYPTHWIEWYIDSKTLYPMLDIKTPELTHTIIYHAFKEEETRYERNDVGERFGYRPYKSFPKTFWQRFLQFIKDCIP